MWQFIHLVNSLFLDSYTKTMKPRMVGEIAEYKGIIASYCILKPRLRGTSLYKNWYDSIIPFK